MRLNNKQVLKNKVAYLEEALLEADFTMKSLVYRVDQLQGIIDKFKKTDNQEDLNQNNDLILNMMKERLNFGAKEYHMNVPIMPEDDITRDNFYEAIQEALDLSVYLCAYLLRLMAEKERREGEAKPSGAKADLKNYGPAYSAALSTSIDKEKHENAKEKAKQRKK